MRIRHQPWWIGIAAVGAVVAGCAAALKHPTAEDAQWAAARWPETTLSDLEHGRALYVQKCSGCHNLHLPEEFAPDEWEGYVAYMVADAKLTQDEQLAITRFLTAASARGRGTIVTSDSTRAAGR